MRAFIAIDLNEELKNTLSFFIDKLNKLNERNRSIKWISSEGMHLTLKFLGEINRERVSEIENALEKTSANFKPFILKFKGTGCFPPGGKNPKVLWVGIEKEKTLEALQSQLEKELEKLGFSREQRKFHPHLTLGRVKSSFNLKQILTLFDQYRDRYFGEMKAEKITFFQSILKPTGAEYSVLSEFKLE